LRIPDLLDESVLGIGTRPARLILTMVGTVAGIAALVATLGLGQTAGGQIAGRFDAVAATRVVVSVPAPPGPPGESADKSGLPWDAAERALRLAGVDAAATVSEVDIGDDRVAGVKLVDPAGANTLDVPVLAASPGLLDAESGTLSTGRFFDEGHSRRGDRVVILGSRAAEALGINRVDSMPSIFIGDTAYVVIGIIDSAQRRSEILDAVIIPEGTAAAEYELAAPGDLDLRTAIGAAQQVSRQVSVAIAPADPTTVKVKAPPPPGALGDDVGSDVNGLFLAFGAVALVVGGLGIANVTLLSVMERTGEIGLRRALGAKRRHIAGQFLTESAMIGTIGGLIGAALGILAVLVVCLAREWTPVLDTWLALIAPPLGIVIGLLAGAYPAFKAAAVEPMTALRQGS